MTRVSTSSVQLQYNMGICKHYATSIQSVCKHSKTSIQSGRRQVQCNFNTVNGFSKHYATSTKEGRGAGWGRQFPFVDVGPDECKCNFAIRCMHAHTHQHLKRQHSPFFSNSIRASEYFIAPKYTRACGILQTDNRVPWESCKQITVYLGNPANSASNVNMLMNPTWSHLVTMLMLMNAAHSQLTW